MNLKIPNKVYKYLRRLTKKYPKIESIWFLGSRANNNFKDDSDCDFWVFANKGIFNLLKRDKSFKQESKRNKIDTLIVYDGKNFEEPWPLLRNGRVIPKQGLLSEWKWEPISSFRANYEGTKEKTRVGPDGKPVFDIEQRLLRAFKIWGHKKTIPYGFVKSKRVRV